MSANRDDTASAPGGGVTGGGGWDLPQARVARLALALGYPYNAPGQSFVFRDGGVEAFRDSALAGRTPVLAHGSNRAPSQLARKFAAFPRAASVIPVTYIWLHDYDVVYSAHITRYGAVASTLHPAPGCRVRVALTWLDDRQLDRMHETEGNYGFGHLQGVTVTSEAGPSDLGDRIAMYLSDHGCLGLQGAPIALAAVEARNRPHRGHTQGQILEALRRHLAPDSGFERFVLDAVSDPAIRQERIAGLAKTAFPSGVPHFRPA